MVRVLTPVAFGWMDVEGCRSMSIERIPKRDSEIALQRPAGPAPMIRMDVCTGHLSMGSIQVTPRTCDSRANP